MKLFRICCFTQVLLLYFLLPQGSSYSSSSSSLSAAAPRSQSDQQDICRLLYQSIGDDKNANLPREVELAVTRHIFYSHLPKAHQDAGEYSRMHDVDNWPSCVSACCGIPECDVALFTTGYCYHIKCVKTPADACAPVKVSGSKYNDTVMVVIGDVHTYSSDNSGDGNQSPKETTQDSSDAISSSSSSLSSSASSSSSSSLSSSSSSKTPSSTTEQKSPSSPEKSTDSSSPSSSLSSSTSSSSSSSTIKKLEGHACVVALGECIGTAECVKPAGSKTRQGVCRCKDGFSPTKDHLCDPKPPSPPSGSLSGSTAKPTPATPKPVTKLTVSAGQNQTLQLPTDSITLKAIVLPSPLEGEKYSYEWSGLQLPDNAKTANMEGKNTNTLTLSQLVSGLYVLRIKVTGTNKFGEAVISVTVIPPKRENQIPVAIIHPATQEIFLPNSAILDGSGSTDDDKIVSYKWEEVSGPLQNHDLDTDSPMLTVKDMAPGNYVFRLTVTDSDGATNSTEANVLIKKEKDYPPKADAGSDRVIHLPQTSLTLYGNASSDDNGKLEYEWTRSADDNAVGMMGVRSPFLHVTNLEVGDFSFTLKVTDSAGQTDTADVHVFVTKESNHPPVAKTGGEVTAVLPQESLTLDGSESTDDQDKMEYSWQQTGGPTTLTITSSDKSIALATGDIQEGTYEFTLTVVDGEQQQSTDTLTVIVKSDVNQPPIANAGGDQVVINPTGVVTLDGSASSDDHGIKSYKWQRNGKSLAAGAVIKESDHQAVLQLANLIVGQYLFTLTVEDAEGATSSDSVAVLVKKNPHEKDFVELILKADINSFTTSNKESLIDQLELLLQNPSEDQETVVHLMTLAEDITTGNLALSFLVSQKQTEETTSVMPGSKALALLLDKLDTGKILDYSIIRLDLLLCQNNCSFHGYCDQKTKQCVCEAFWMANFFSSSTVISSNSNCDWSILYVVIICFILLVVFISLGWVVVCCCASRRCKVRLKSKRRHRYSLLRDADNKDSHEKLEMMTKSKIQTSSVMISESDLSSEDEETLFISNKKPSSSSNGLMKLANGSSSKSAYRNKLKT